MISRDEANWPPRWPTIAIDALRGPSHATAAGAGFSRSPSD